LVQSRLDLAKSLGADHTILLSRESDEKGVVQQVHKLLGKEPDKSIECSGAESSIRIAIQVAKFYILLPLKTFLEIFTVMKY